MGAGLAWRTRLLSNRWPLVGGWLRRRAARALIADGSAGAAARLAAALPGLPTEAAAAVVDHLGRLEAPAARAAVAEVWRQTRLAPLAALLPAWGPDLPASPACRVLVALLLDRPDGVASDGEAEALLDACGEVDPALAARARGWVPRHDRAWRHALARWEASRDEGLFALVAAAGRLPDGPPRLRWLVALRLGRDGPARDASAEEVPALVELAGDRDEAVARRAEGVLAGLARPEARRRLCGLALEGDEVAGSACRTGGHLPEEPHEAAMLLFVLDRWADYQRLDFDHSLLRRGYEAAAPAVRRTLTAAARRQGRADFATLLAGSRPDRLEALSDEEWQLTIDLLARNGRWQRLWELTRQAPAVWGLAALGRLREADWRPPAGEAAAFDALLALAAQVGVGDFGPGEAFRGRYELGLGAITSVAFHPSEPIVAAAGGGVGLIDVERHRVLPAPAVEDATCLVFAPGGSPLVVGRRCGHVQLVWTGAAPRVRTLHGCGGEITAVALTPDGKTLLALSDDFVQVWDLTDEEPENKPLDFSADLTCMAVSPDGETLAVGCRDGSVWLTCHLPYPEIRDRLAGHEGAVRDLAFGADGAALASVDENGTPRRWRLAGLRPTDVGPAGDGDPFGPGFTPDPSRVVSRRGAASAWLRGGGARLVAGRLVLRGPDGEEVAAGDGDRPVTTLAADAAGQRVATGAGGAVALWGLPARLGRLARRPLGEVTPGDWDWLRQGPGGAEAGAAERRAAGLFDALLRARWQGEIHAEEAVAAAGPYDVTVEESCP